MQDNLSQYGQTFQTKVIISLLKDREFLQQVSDLIDPTYFESQANSWLVEKIISYYEKYKSPPTSDVFKSELLVVEDKILKTTVVDALKQVKKYTDNSDDEYVKNTVLEFCKNQKMKIAILESVDLLRSGKYDLI